MQSTAKTVKQYLAELTSSRRAAITAMRKTILEHLPAGYEEGMQYGMIGYFVPHSIFPEGYHCAPEEPLPFAALASQKNHMALYLMATGEDDGQRDWLRKTWTATGKRLDMGKCCVRFKRIEDVPLDVVGRAISRVSVQDYIDTYRVLRADEAARRSLAPARKPARKNAGAKTATSKLQPSRLRKKA